MTKYQTISALAEYTARNVAQSEDNWKHYLTTAARLYMIIPGLSEPPVRTLRFFRNYPFLPFYIIGHIV